MQLYNRKTVPVVVSLKNYPRFLLLAQACGAL
jgi:hypothetical protein